MSGITIALVAGVLIIAVLGWVAARELKKVAALEAAQREKDQTRMSNLRISVDAIARAVMSDQCDISEWALRLKPLLDATDPNWVDRSDLRPILVMAEALADQPIKDARQALSKQERMRLDLQRYKLEAEHSNAVKGACQALVRLDS